MNSQVTIVYKTNAQLLTLFSLGVITVGSSNIAHADTLNGKIWLSSQIQQPISNIANDLQTKQEITSTLKALHSQIEITDLASTLEVEGSSEGLVRIALLAHSQDQISHPAFQKLINNQNSDGGFAHLEDWQSNPLDTAFVLIALSETNYLSTLDSHSRQSWQARISDALQYLSTQQQIDGAFHISHLDDLYTSSYVLSALTPYLKNYGQYIPITQSLVTYLESKQTAPATWSNQLQNKGLFLDALVAESLYPYQESNEIESFKSSFNNRVLTLQNSNGSWQEDAYVTSLVLHTLDELSQSVINPITSSISLSILDTETSLSLGGVSLTANGESFNILSNNNGEISVSDLKPGNYVFSLEKDGYATIQFKINLRKGEQLNLGQVKLSRATAVSNGQIQGVVTDKIIGEPISNAIITVVLVGSDGRRLADFEPIEAISNNLGAYQIVLTQAQQEASKGRFGIDVRAQGYASVQGSGTATAGGVIMFSPQMMSQTQFQAILTAKVVDNAGQPLSNVEFTNSLNDKVANSDVSGVTTIHGLLTGSQVWSLHKDGYQDVSFNFVVEDARTYDAGTIALNKIELTDPSNPNSDPIAPLTGYFNFAPTDAATHKKLQDYKVVAEKLDTNSNNVIQTQSFAPDVEHSIASELNVELPTGKWRITVSHPAYKSSVQTFILGNDQYVTVAPTLVLNPYALSGSIVDSQTNLPISSAPIVVFNDDTDQTLYSGKSDTNGHFTVPSNLSSSNLRIEINPALYLSTTRYVSRQTDTTTNVDVGEIRLRPKSAEVVLPDLFISALDSSSLSTSQQQLITTGSLIATVENKGNADLSRSDTKIKAFIDSNKNRKYDDGEQIVADAILAVALKQGENDHITLDINSKVAFKDAPIAVMIDSDEQIAEQEEDNNVRLTSDGVEIKPPVGTLEAEVKWSGGYSNDSGAVAAPLSDSNEDGIIGQGDISSVIVYSGNSYRVLNGLTGKLEFSIQGGGAQELAAVADVDIDGLPDIIVPAGDGLRVYSNTGVLKKLLPARMSFSGWADRAIHPIIADLNKDGIPEIILNNKIFTYQDGLIKDNLPSGQSQAIADVNDDGLLDIIGLSGVSDSTGIGLYKFKNKAGNNITLKFLAVGDVLGSEAPQVIAIYSNYVMILDAKSGKTIAEHNPSSNAGGSPVIADFDGDGISDIGIARRYRYVAMRGDGSEIWSTPISDSSGGTGSTVFDFDNDGKTEAVHFDERYLRIYDAATGIERIKIPNNTATAHEYPIVGDFDADGHADIIITAGSNGTRMISSKNKDWANTRNIWNQYSYHVTNINDDLSVPKNEPNSWEVHNTYRANLLLNQNATAASDLTTSYLQIDDNGINGNSHFSARIGNAGGKPVAKGTPISFYRLPTGANATQAELLEMVTLEETLDGGAYIDISINYAPTNGTLADFGELVVIANDAGAGLDSATGIPNPTDPNNPTPDNNFGVVQEYTRSNNTSKIAVTGDFSAFSLVGEVDKTNYNANETVNITSTPTNLGSFPTQPNVRVSILDSAGNLIQEFADTQADLGVAITNIGNPPVNSANIVNTWNTTNSRVGNYTAHIELIYKNEVVAEVDRGFAIVADGVQPAQTKTQLYLDKTQYLSTDLVSIQSRLINTASNAMAGKREVTLVATDPNGQQIWTTNYSYDELAPNAIKDQYFTLPLVEAQNGNYQVTSITTYADGSQEASISQSFEILSAAISGFGITGEISAPTTVHVGESLDWQWIVKNTSFESLNSLPLSIALYRNNESDAFMELPLSSIDIEGKKSLSGIKSWISTGIAGEQITAILLAEFEQSKQGLAQTQIMLTEPPINVVFNDEAQLSDTLLVYYSCAPGILTSLNNSSYGLNEHKCFDERADILERYLDRIDVPYKLVNRPELFADEMQSGKYSQYWLLGAIEQLRPHHRKELTEMAYSGDNLLVDSGMSSWLNQNLYELAGADHKGRLLLSTNLLHIHNQYIKTPTDTAIASTPLELSTRQVSGYPLYSTWAQWLTPTDPNSTQIWATVDGQRKRTSSLAQRREETRSYPAILSQTYGNGMPVAVGFDIINSLDLATTIDLPPYPDAQSPTNAMELRWDSLLTQLVTPRRINTKIEYVPHEVVRLPIRISNSSSQSKNILVSIDLPVGSQWLGYDGGIGNTIKEDHTINYQITIASEHSIDDVLAVRLPVLAGNHPIRVTVSDITNGTQNAIEIEQYEARYLVRDIDSRIDLINNTIRSWNVLGVNGVNKLNAKTKMSLINTHRSTGVRQLTVYETANLATIISMMQKNDDSVELQQLRYELDELLRALQIDWYVDRDGYVPLP